MWCELVQLYALRARELSDAVAQLAQHIDVRETLLALIEEIERRNALCSAVCRRNRSVLAADLQFGHGYG
jgi:hypothetical protein